MPSDVELYDLERDPGERFDVAKDYPVSLARSRARLEAFEVSPVSRGGSTEIRK